MENLQQRRQAQLAWQTLAAANQATAVQLAETLQTRGLADVAAYINRSSRGVVVTTLHGGDYLLALLRLRLALGNRRRILVVRKKAPSKLEKAVFDRIGQGTDLEVVRHEEKRAIRLVRALRQGHLVVALFDLPASYGPTAEVSLLGQSMHLVRGPAELAVLGEADIIPMVAWRNGPLPHMACLPPLRPAAVETACRQLAEIATGYILAQPAQWQHWFHIPEMLAPPGKWS
ncbi:MAG: hypothetical protein ACFHX7_01720 [Pseudomonadota bacterium]